MLFLVDIHGILSFIKQHPVLRSSKTMETDSTKHDKPHEAKCIDNKVEIERKFAVSGDAGERILQAGGKCIREATFEDVYYDNDIYQLTLADHWLRARDGCWELKAGIHQDRLNETCTKYVEIDVESEIVQRLDAILRKNVNPEVNNEQPDCRNTACVSLQEYLKHNSIHMFATFKTNRTYYQIEDDITIVLDTADFGFNVGEIEIMASESEADIAANRLETLSQELGFGDLSAVNFDHLMPQSWLQSQQQEAEDGDRRDSNHIVSELNI